MKFDIWSVYSNMLHSRLFEEAVIDLWQKGKISGEMHLSIGEEAIVAGTVLQLEDGDAMALDHRGTAALIMRGVDPVLVLKEMLASRTGLCAGRGGHMHLFSKAHLAASSGIVGAAAPTAVGLALSASRLRPGKIALAYFGEGAMNQGMVVESLNLAVVWKLPVIFICKDDQWAITTRSATVTAGDITNRARSFDMPVEKVDGSDAEDVWQFAAEAIRRARMGGGPSFIHARCVHPHGHFLGDPLLRTIKNPFKEMTKMAGPLLKSVTKKKGVSMARRADSIRTVTSLLRKSSEKKDFHKNDPLSLILNRLEAEKQRLKILQAKTSDEIKKIISAVTSADFSAGELS